MLDTLLPAPRQLKEAGGQSPLSAADLETLARKLQPWAPQAARAILSLMTVAAQTPADSTTATQPAATPQITAQHDPSLGAEEYTLEFSNEQWALRAGDAAGAFWAVQTLRQAIADGVVPHFSCADGPKYPIRGAMLDISRHFFTVAEIKWFIDLAASYKYNQVHLHLTDDQGWRIEIEDRPLLTELGSGTDVSGGAGGFLTLAEFKEVQEYGLEQHVVIVPEIDLPGHTHAAMLAYPEIAPDDKEREPFTGLDVGFSSVDLTSDAAWAFIDDVVSSISRNTLGPRIHLGGDEALTLERDEYVTFVERLGAVAAEYGKELIMWQEAAGAKLPAGTLIQYWTAKLDAAHFADVARKQDVQFIASPGHRSYLDHAHVKGEPGQDWAGAIELRDAYEWEPVDELPGVPQESIVGVETCLWTEMVPDFDTMSYRLLPRFPAVAEVAWGSPKNWDRFAKAVVVHSKNWTAQGWKFYASEQVDWT